MITQVTLLGPVAQPVAIAHQNFKPREGAHIFAFEVQGGLVEASQIARRMESLGNAVQMGASTVATSEPPESRPLQTDPSTGAGDVQPGQDELVQPEQAAPPADQVAPDQADQAPKKPAAAPRKSKPKAKSSK